MSVVVGGGVGPQVKNFEQVSSNDHQISLAGAWTGCPRSAVGRGVEGQWRPRLHG